MAWGNRNWDCPRLTNYADAANWEKHVKPIRGDMQGTKPLGNRRKKWFNIRRDGDDVVIKMHNTDVIRYKPDGDVIINNGGWVSASTHDFFTMVLGLYVRTFDGKGWATCYMQPDGIVRTEPLHGQFVMPNNKDITLRRYNHDWLTTELNLPNTHTINRTKANILRKTYAPFKKYMDGIIKLRAETYENSTWRGDIEVYEAVTITFQELRENGVSVNYSDRNGVYMDGFGPRNDGIAQNLRGMMLSGDADQYYKAFLIIARSSKTGYFYGMSTSEKIMISPKEINDFYKKLILFIHKNDVLDKTAVETGKSKRDPFGKWF